MRKTLLFLAVSVCAIPIFAQTPVDPGTSVTIGAATDLSESVSSCGGLNSCGVEADLAAKTMGAVTALSGIGSTKTARVSLLNRFVVSGDNGRGLGARLSGNVSWSGDLESFGAVGAAAFVNVGVSIVDLTNNLTVGGQTLLSEGCETFLVLDSCLRRISGSRALNVPFQVQIGHEYEIRFSLECSSNSGVGDANCVFNQNGAFPLAGGQVGRSDLTLTVEADIVGLLEEIRDQVYMLKDQLAEHDERLADHEVAEAERFRMLKEAADRNFRAVLESLRLLLTPEGRRATNLPVCDGLPCAFPDGARASSIEECSEGEDCETEQEVGGQPTETPGPGDRSETPGWGRRIR